MNEDQRKLAQRLLKEGKSVREVARTFSVHPATLYRIVAPSPRNGYFAAGDTNVGFTP
jgi:DNA invertase Pin-like site-specific DNA recombinase